MDALDRNATARAGKRVSKKVLLIHSQFATFLSLRIAWFTVRNIANS
jgi:hypothetical protein